ncbi:tRNA (guanosine(46)-N7)-methyltransferase TrmB [Kosmotoga pacifica]|uniref:tRNA (guanine-N(7)-)-methyltransferase n=1 Tax=Kosmotoga pacifica TaxID=1330330 RepID=A0A0G2ZCJ4_9BACT|nr:tRNA (guanosine(46)-N7)-methyltransferase TrmB [Kosmotoga pacifica]AKI96478.1 hypothetical protein IX53_00015 [Kosmotoga pacifica]
MNVNVDTLKYFIDPASMSLPVDTKNIFGKDRELFLEVGFGNGEFLVEMAENHPEYNFFGLELSLISLVKVQKQLYKKGLENVRVALVDARFGVRELFSRESFSGFYMNFPCPWPKKSHARKRLNDREFLTSIAAILKKDGFFQLYTDDDNFAMDFKRSAEATGCFKDIELVKNPQMGVNTRYEQKWKKENRDIFRVYGVKVMTPNIEKITGGEEMPHSWIGGVIDIDNLKKIINERFSENGTTYIYKNIYLDLFNERYLVETIAVDGDFEQKFYIEVKRKSKKDAWIVRLNGHGLPYRTKAVKRAVYGLAEILKKGE